MEEGGALNLRSFVLRNLFSFTRCGACVRVALKSFMSPSFSKEVISIFFLQFRPSGSDQQKNQGHAFGRLLWRLVSGNYFVGW